MNNVAQHYLINMRDGRVILYTDQAARQVDYHSISEEVAKAIDDGRLTSETVIARIKANLINNQDAWDDLLKKKTTTNVHRSTLTRDDSEGTGTTPSAEEAGEEFNMDVPAGGAHAGEGAPANAGAGDAPAPKNNQGVKRVRGARRGGENNAAGEGAPANAGDAEAGAGEATAAEDAGAGAGEPLKV